MNDLTVIEPQHPANNPEQNPVAVYLASLSTGSRRTIKGALETVGEILTGHAVNPVALPWWEVEYQHSQAARSALAERYSSAMANKCLSALRGVLRESWRLGYMQAEQYHRAVDLKSIKGSPAPTGRAVSVGEVRALVEVCQSKGATGTRDLAMLGVLWSGGLRRAEVVNLNLADYEPETGALTIHRAKGGKGRRVFIKNGASQALEVWLAIRGNEPGPLFYRTRKGGAIIPEKLTDQTVQDLIAKRTRQAGIAKFSPHDLRRSFAGELLDSGTDLVTVQRLMGHASPVTTSGYDRRDERTMAEASTKLTFPFTA